MSLLQTLREQIEYAPTSGYVVNPELVGWTVRHGGETVHICADCAGRILGRGFGLGRDVSAVWDGAILCALCELIPLTTEN